MNKKILITFLIFGCSAAFAWKNPEGTQFKSLKECLDSNKQTHCVAEKFTSEKDFFASNPSFRAAAKPKGNVVDGSGNEKGWACLEGGGKITAGKCSTKKGVSFYQYT